ncbi:hypothetical protein [Nostoc sp. TCL26-01]|uniref:hypothetical protein n=1 Tax=Nostoc sp. TCL26-01 TaxID=2576904 RepID=UPI0015BF1E9F|nr:hypothetical protein [Nostoc sp. TCL26-01]QLE54820.1 hypothetical protein FD725_04400 [Nostoc sp. TCL26-01]
MNKAKRAVIKIASIEVEVFQLPVGEYVMSQSQVGKAIDADRETVKRFIERKNQGYRSGHNQSANDIKPLSGKDYRSHKMEREKTLSGRGGGNEIKVIPIDLASEFWFEQAMKGNSKAQGLTKACLEETLERRCDRAFEQVKTEEEYEKATGIKCQTWLESRELCRYSHGSFHSTCKDNDFIRGLVHNKITLAVCGKTAKELKKEALVNGNIKVGLNHIASSEILEIIAIVKMEFGTYRTGTPSERIKRALKKLGITPVVEI